MLRLLLVLVAAPIWADTPSFDALYRQTGADLRRAAEEFPAPLPPPPKQRKVTGWVAGEQISSSVDSEEAGLYLQGLVSQAPELKRKIAAYRAAAAGVALHQLGPILRDVSQNISPDTSALLFAEIVSETGYGPRWREEYQSHLRRWKEAGRRLPAEAGSIVVLAVPAFLYRTYPESGAGLEHVIAIARGMGLRAERVELGENAAVEDNARRLADEIRRRGAVGERLVLVSGSKSSAEVAEALGRYLSPQEALSVCAWINGAGSLRGSPLADTATTLPARLLVALRMAAIGHGMAGLDSLRSDVRRPSFDFLSLPSSVLIVNLVAVPMSGNIWRDNRSNYARLNEHGPNDGVVLLTDAIVPGAVTLLKPGVDHYMAGKIDADALGALIYWVCR